jgi:LPS-assembly protein
VIIDSTKRPATAAPSRQIAATSLLAARLAPKRRLPSLHLSLDHPPVQPIASQPLASIARVRTDAGGATPARWRRSALSAAALALLAQGAHGQAEPPLPGTTLQVAPELRPLSATDSSAPLPLILSADQLQGRPGLDATAQGHVELRRGGTVIRSDQLSYDTPDDLATATGHVRVSRGGNVFSGPKLQLHVQSFQGHFDEPDYFFALTQAGGHAKRIDFLDAHRSQAIDATYSSCPRNGSSEPPWVLNTDRVTLDFATNTGTAEGAVVHFYGVPILAAPVLTFPLSDERKSGWLPPSINLDSKSGFELGVPYYWNIAPNRDATFTPTAMTRRGMSLDSEFRYLEPQFKGKLDFNLLPDDQLTHRTRHALQFTHDGEAGLSLHYGAEVLRVSDDAYWKDFPSGVPSLTPRLLPEDVHADRGLPWLPGDWSVYARAQRWQVLNDADPDSPIAPPYDRVPQFGLRGGGDFGGWQRGPRYSFETEVNRFELAEGAIGTSSVRPTDGTRLHFRGDLSWPVTLPGGWLTPRVSLNAASYRYRYGADGLDPTAIDGSATRTIPTFSLDTGLVFERPTHWLGQAMRQTLEPRLLLVETPYRDQSNLPDFDAAGKDFNDISIFSDNAFAGVDRVSDAHQLTAGVTTRWLDERTGAEAMRLGIVQRYQFRAQQITPATEGGTDVQGPPSTNNLSDVLLLGSANLQPAWSLNGSLEYSPDIHRPIRSLLGVRYSPGPYRTLNLNYRLVRGSSEQVELGWQWPIYGPAAHHAVPDAGQCSGSWYSVGRLNYSKPDKRFTDAIAGFEYDAGCWIGRVVAERVSTGLAQATTRVMFQLELVGLSRLGSNPLQVLKDNIPGYRLLREERAAPFASASYD